MDAYADAADEADDADDVTPAPGAPAVSAETPDVEVGTAAVPQTVGEAARALNALYPSAAANLSGPAFLAAQAEKEKAGAEAHAVDLPVVDASTDGVRWAEPAAANVTDYGSVMAAPPGYTFTEPAEVALAKDAMVRAGVGITLAGKFFGLYVESAKGDPAKFTEAKGMETLQARFGDQAEATIADARSFYRQLLAKWPGAARFLNESGLGNDPRMIALMARAARRNKK